MASDQPRFSARRNPCAEGKPRYCASLMDGGSPCQKLDWDTEFFGFPIARAVGRRLDEPAADAIDAWCEAHGIRCLYFLADPHDPETARIASERGFRHVDDRIRLTHSLDRLDGPASTAEIRDARRGDVDRLAEIASVSHTDSRFFADPGFPRDRCAEMYERWVANAVADPVRPVRVPVIDGRAVGYQVISPPDEDRIGRLEILAIDEEARGAGIASQLLLHSLEWCAEQGAAGVVTITQGRNTASLEVHRRVGFSDEIEGLWHHRWYDENGG
jgi:dTDP-4-amino-4,6-dideoxy-D-galactose acyltransferase